MYCENCGKKIPDDDKFCGECGQGINGEKETYEIKEIDITKIKKWSWGGFFLNWIYLIGMQASWWITLLFFVCNSIPVINVVSWIYLGLEGRRMAWKQRKWHNFSKYLEVQKKWDIWAIVIIVASLILGVITAYYE